MGRYGNKIKGNKHELSKVEQESMERLFEVIQNAHATTLDEMVLQALVDRRGGEFVGIDEKDSNDPAAVLAASVREAVSSSMRDMGMRENRAGVGMDSMEQREDSQATLGNNNYAKAFKRMNKNHV